MAETRTAAAAAGTQTPIFDDIGMLTLHVTDFDRAVRFYRDTLGLHPGGMWPEAEFGEFELKSGAKLGLHGDKECAKRDDGRRPGGATGFLISTPDARSTAADLKRRGVRITQDVTESSFGTWISCEDPDGTEFMRVQWPAGA